MKKILDIVDMQNSFITPGGILSIQGTASLASKANDFLQRIKAQQFEAVLFKQDTHFIDEYPSTQESKHFPMHCEFGSYDWELAIDTSLVQNKSACYRLLKNNFSMWDATTKQANYPHNPEYQKLFSVSSYASGHDPLTAKTMDNFLLNFSPAETAVFLMGVSSDYCVKYALDGYLSRGYNVYIISDLTAGIYYSAEIVLLDIRYQSSNLLGNKVKLVSIEDVFTRLL